MGCGSGILSVIAKETGNYGGQISLIDSNESAINCAKMNLALYGVFEHQLISKNADIVDIWFPSSGTPDAEKRPKQQEFYDNILDDIGIPKPVDLILCNPPWIPASFMKMNSQSPTDDAVFDPNEKFLISSLNFAKHHLDPKSGEMLLIYSNLAQNLGITEPNRVSTLSKDFGLEATLLDETNIPMSKKLNEPLKMIKR